MNELAKRTSQRDGGVLAIVVGGGPAPGLNGVISASTIEAVNNGFEVIGIMDGFKWLSQGSIDHVRRLAIPDVSRIHLRGGCLLRTSRSNPTKSPELMGNVVSSLNRLNVTHLVTIGGDDTCYTASRIAERVNEDIKIAHVPKTIDNDLPLPSLIPTFGYETARYVGTNIVKNLHEDARTTGRWYFVVAMGRTAGHLALGIGKSAGSTLIVIREEFGNREVTIKELCNILEGSIIKRLSMGREFGVAILSEGLAEGINEQELAAYGTVEHDEHGHIRLSEINLGQVVKETVRNSLEERGIKIMIVNKDLGYELRSADPNPFDLEYTRTLGYGAMKFLMGGGTDALITIQGGSLTPIPFKDLIDPQTGRTRVREVDIHSENYEVSRKYMIRLEPEDLSDSSRLAKLAASGNMTPREFQDRFLYLVDPDNAVANVRV